MPRKPKLPVEEGDHVALHGKVTRVVDPGYGRSILVTVRVDGYAVPVTIGLDWIEVIVKGREPKVRDLRE